VPLVFQRFARHRAMDYYARLTVNGWDWVDKRALPTFVGHFGPRSAKPTSNIDDLYWSLNMVRLSATPSWNEGGSRLTITLEHCMPWFDHYEIRIDGGEWRPVEATFEWPMREGVNSLECRAVNVRNRPGIISRIEVAHARPPDAGPT